MKVIKKGLNDFQMACQKQSEEFDAQLCKLEEERNLLKDVSDKLQFIQTSDEDGDSDSEASFLQLSEVDSKSVDEAVAVERRKEGMDKLAQLANDGHFPEIIQ